MKTISWLTVVLAMAVQALSAAAAWSQGHPQPQMNEELAKQEKIYRSRGPDVPSGYVTNRGLSDYADLLPSGFCDALGSLGTSDRWLDIGAGEGQAILDYYAPPDDRPPAERCARSAGRARAVAISIEDRQTEKWQQHSAALGDQRMRYLSGKRLSQYSPEELGKFQIITDVYGGFSYSDNLSRFVQQVLNLLDTGGVFYTVVQSVHLDNGKEKPDMYYQTELLDPAGGNVKVCSWLKKISCAKVVCQSKSDWDTPSELISIHKMCSGASVPHMKLIKYQAGNPPTRRFQMEP